MRRPTILFWSIKFVCMLKTSWHLWITGHTRFFSYTYLAQCTAHFPDSPNTSMIVRPPCSFEVVSYCINMFSFCSKSLRILFSIYDSNIKGNSSIKIAVVSVCFICCFTFEHWFKSQMINITHKKKSQTIYLEKKFELCMEAKTDFFDKWRNLYISN